MASEHPGRSVSLMREPRTTGRNRHGRIARHRGQVGCGLPQARIPRGCHLPIDCSLQRRARAGDRGRHPGPRHGAEGRRGGEGALRARRHATQDHGQRQFLRRMGPSPDRVRVASLLTRWPAHTGYDVPGKPCDPADGEGALVCSARARFSTMVSTPPDPLAKQDASVRQMSETARRVTRNTRAHPARPGVGPASEVRC